MLDAATRTALEACVDRWVYEETTRRISGRDSQGNLVMAIVAGPSFGERLAAAFGEARPASVAPVSPRRTVAFPHPR